MSVRRRRDPRREATRQALIETGEVMFGLRGIDGVSLRQIGVAIGSHNNNVVAYHFGSKEALIDAIFQHRLPEFERQRGLLLASRSDTADIRTSLRMLWQPLFDQRGLDGSRSFARFQSALIRSFHPSTIQIGNPEYVATRQLVRTISDHVAAVEGVAFQLRWPMVTVMVLDAFRQMDYHALDNTERAECMFVDVLNMAATALMAPVDLAV